MKRAARVLFVVVAALVAACAEDLPVAKCGVIPAGGCPRSDDACRDPECAAVYFCAIGGAWTLDHACEPRDAGARDAADASSDLDGRGGRDASTDVPGAAGGPGGEDLALPDCSLSVALACGQSCCECEDLFVCEDGGWSLWGSCEGGVIVADARDARRP
jgi:hypothetical protein